MMSNYYCIQTICDLYKKTIFMNPPSSQLRLSCAQCLDVSRRRPRRLHGGSLQAIA
jgi:hypothetical protein